MNRFYEDVLTDILTDMRLTAEGAVTLFENEAAPLFVLAMDTKQHEAKNAFNTIGNAIYILRDSVRLLQLLQWKDETQLSNFD